MLRLELQLHPFLTTFSKKLVTGYKNFKILNNDHQNYTTVLHFWGTERLQHNRREEELLLGDCQLTGDEGHLWEAKLPMGTQDAEEKAQTLSRMHTTHTNVCVCLQKDAAVQESGWCVCALDSWQW